MDDRRYVGQLELKGRDWLIAPVGVVFGTTLLPEISWLRFQAAAPLCILCPPDDMKDRIRESERLDCLNRGLRTIAICKRASLRAENEQTLLEGTCRIAYEEAGGRVARVGYLRHDAVQSVALLVWGTGSAWPWLLGGIIHSGLVEGLGRFFSIWLVLPNKLNMQIASARNGK